MRNLSILIPSYNDICLPLVEELKAQADSIDGLCYEIIVADDGSTDENVLSTNRKIESLDGCSFIERGMNVGRAAIRNFLGKEAKYEWLVFLDCEVRPADTFINIYASNESPADVICGGISIGGDAEKLKNNLRYLYEKSMEPSYSSRERNKHGFYSFRTTNFMIKKSVFLQSLFNESMTTYGYEDVVFGKQLKQKGFSIEHIDNPVSMFKYENNKRLVEKTEEALRTLKAFSDEVCDYSSIISCTNVMKRLRLIGIVRYCFQLTNKKLRTNLCGENPKLLFYKLYKLGYFINL